MDRGRFQVRCPQVLTIESQMHDCFQVTAKGVRFDSVAPASIDHRLAFRDGGGDGARVGTLPSKSCTSFSFCSG